MKKSVSCARLWLLGALLGAFSLGAQASVISIAASFARDIRDTNFDGTGDTLGGSALVASAGHNPPPEGLRRYQIEWDLSALQGLQVSAASVSLTTLRGTIDSLDTYFYHGTTSQDGAGTAADYAAPASIIPGAVMPVPVSTVGTVGSFQFDVTSELLSDLQNNFDYFSVQGRVDETGVGASTPVNRGLQIYTTSFDPASRHPQLIVTYDVPEPGTYVLLAAASALLLGFRVRRRPRRG